MGKKRVGQSILPRVGPGRPRYGAQAWLNTGTLPSSKAWLARMVEGICREYAEDLGGNPTTGQIILLAEIKKLLVYMALIDEHIAELGGPFREKGELHSVLSGFYMSCSNAVQRAVERLGMKRIDKGSLVLQDYIKQHDERKAKETQASSGQRKGNRQEAPGGAISEPVDQQDGKEDESLAAPGAPSPRVAGESDPDKKMED